MPPPPKKKVFHRFGTSLAKYPSHGDNPWIFHHQTFSKTKKLPHLRRLEAKSRMPEIACATTSIYPQITEIKDKYSNISSKNRENMSFVLVL